VEGVPSWVLYAVDFSRGSAEVLAGERSSLSPRSLLSRQSHPSIILLRASRAHTSLHPWPGPSASSCAWAGGCGTRCRRRCSWCMGSPMRRRRIVPIAGYVAFWQHGGSAADYSLSSRDRLRCVVVSIRYPGRPRCRGSRAEPYIPPTAMAPPSYHQGRRYRQDMGRTHFRTPGWRVAAGKTGVQGELTATTPTAWLV